MSNNFFSRLAGQFWCDDTKTIANSLNYLVLQFRVLEIKTHSWYRLKKLLILFRVRLLLYFNTCLKSALCPADYSSKIFPIPGCVYFTDFRSTYWSLKALNYTPISCNRCNCRWLQLKKLRHVGNHHAKIGDS